MCGKKEEDQQATGECSHQSIHNNNVQGYHHHHQLFLQQQHQLQLEHQYNTSTNPYAGDGGNTTGKAAAGLIFPNEVSPIVQWALPPVHNSFNNPVHHDPFLVPTPPPPNTSYSGLFNRTRSAVSALQFAYHHEGPSSDHHHHHLRILSDPSVLGVSSIQPCSSPFALQAELGKLTAQEIMDAKALAASKSHSEAERRRRERINNHLAKLRSMLPSTTKTDKASLLAEVIQHVKELKRQTSQIAEASPVPTETDELVVDTVDEDGRFLIKASLCCEDRSDLLPDLIKTLKALRLRTLKAEITTLGGRVKNVLVITGEDQETNNNSNNNSNIDQSGAHQQLSISSIQEALKAVMERTANDDSSPGSVKRQRTNISMIEHKSI